MIDALRYESAGPHHRLHLLDGAARTSALRPHRPGVRHRYPRLKPAPRGSHPSPRCRRGESAVLRTGLAVSIIGILSTATNTGTARSTPR